MSAVTSVCSNRELLSPLVLSRASLATCACAGEMGEHASGSKMLPSHLLWCSSGLCCLEHLQGGGELLCGAAGGRYMPECHVVH